MRLEWHEPDNDETANRHPTGYWYASTDTGDCDGVGPDPVTALARLVYCLENKGADPAPVHPLKKEGDNSWEPQQGPRRGAS